MTSTTTLTLKKPSITVEQFEALSAKVDLMVAQNAEILKLLKYKSHPKTTPTKHTTISKDEALEQLFKGFGDGTNYETMLKLVSFVKNNKLSIDDITKIRGRIESLGLKNRHLKSFDALIARNAK